MNLFRVRHPSLGTQYFLADAPSAEEWDDTTHFLPLHHRGAAGRQVRLGSPQHAYKDGLARAQLRDHVPETLTRAQISVERISLDALDEIHVSLRAALTDAGWVGVPNTLLDPRSLTASDFSGVLRGRAGSAAPTGIYFGRAARPHGHAANYVWTETPGGTLCTVFSRTTDGSAVVTHGRGGDISAALDEALWMAGWPAESIKARTGGRTSVEEFLAGLRQGSPGVSTRAETRAEEPTSDTDAARALRERLLDAITCYQEEQSQVHNTVRVLLGYDTPEEHGEDALYGGRTQFSLDGAARELRVAYLRGRYDLLGLITGDLLAYAAAPAAVYPIEGEDP